MTTAAQRIWEAIYAAALVEFATGEHDASESTHTNGVPNIMLDAATFADTHARFATYKPQSRFRKRSS
jgi:hypothetical protein